MTADQYKRKYIWLLEVLKDAEDRGDIYLEYDVKEKLSTLQDTYYQEDQS